MTRLDDGLDGGCICRRVIPPDEEGRLHAFIGQHLQDLRRSRARRIVEGEGHELSVPTRRGVLRHNDAVHRLLDHTAILGDTGLLSRPHLLAAGNTPGLDELDGTGPLDRERGCDLGRLHLMGLVGVRPAFDGHLIPSAELRRCHLAEINLVPVQGDGKRFAARLVEHGVVNCEQAARLEVEGLTLDQALDA